MATSFLGEFLRNPLRTAAIAPSSDRLARAMLEGTDLAAARTVVEFGPGTGVFTRAMTRGLAGAGNDAATFVALELNARLAEALPKSAPGVDARHANALDLPQELGETAHGGVDLIISGLGWPSIPRGPREAILRVTREALRTGGRFHTFGYHIGLCMPGAWHFRRVCRELFSSVEISPVIWANMPPAFVYRCIA